MKRSKKWRPDVLVVELEKSDHVVHNGDTITISFPPISLGGVSLTPSVEFRYQDGHLRQVMAK